MEQFITLLLAWRMAKIYGENESEAIRLCASKELLINPTLES